MTDWGRESKRTYTELSGYAAHRTQELSAMLQPYIEVTDRYGELVCRLTLLLGRLSPNSKEESALRDLMADVFDFLYEARILITKGKLEIAYPLARRAYESLSLMVASHLEPKLAVRWIAGEQIGNSEVRKVLARHPMGESEEFTKELYQFVSRAAHPNRDLVAQRFLGEGNEFVLGAIGRPDLVLLADYAIKTLQLWFWFGAFIGYVHVPILAIRDPKFMEDYHATAQMAKQVAEWLREQFNHVLAQERAAVGKGD